MRIKLTSIMVDDQHKALDFYTNVLGFRVKHNIPVGDYRWITVRSPEGPDDLELAPPSVDAESFDDASIAVVSTANGVRNRRSHLPAPFDDRPPALRTERQSARGTLRS